MCTLSRAAVLAVRDAAEIARRTATIDNTPNRAYLEIEAPMPPNPTPALRGASRRRSWTLAVVMWAFGLSTTTLLVGLWGRGVAADQSTLSESARAAIGAEVVTDRVHDWLEEAAGTIAATADPRIDDGLRAVALSPAAEQAVTQIVDGFIAAAFAPPGAEVTIDVADAVAPLVPTIVAELDTRGIDVEVDDVSAALDDAAAVVLETEESIGVSGMARRARAALTRVLVVGVAALTLFGCLAIALSEDRRAMVRTLAVRLAVSAATFALFLRISAWAVDPSGGRSPLAAGGSVLLGSNHRSLLVTAAGAGAVALVAGLSIRRRRTRRPEPTDERHEDTGERRLVAV